MNKSIFIFGLVLLFISGVTYGFEYQINVDGMLSNSNKTIKLITLNEDKLVLNISGEEKTQPISINSPKDIGESVLIVRSIFYSKNKNESYAIIDFCKKSEELCNNIDDDCDGKIDDGISRECGNNVTKGICRQGVQKCINGEWGYCENIVYPQNEICNNLDDDCDGAIDENITRPCGNSPLTGRCKNGFQKCSNGAWEKCEGYVFPADEKCNNVDDDCDGKIDEDLTKVCGVSDKGICKLGKEECTNGVLQACNGAVFPEAEKCDGLDNDCDGVIDNNCKSDSKGIFSRIKDWFLSIF